MLVENLRDGTWQTSGQVFEEEGLVASGYFEGDKLARHSQLECSAVNFMALRGKYTVSSEGDR